VTDRGRDPAIGHDPAPLPILPDMAAAILALNNAHATELSWLEPERLATLLAQAFHARRIGAFVYVDRVAVAPAARGRGYACTLYADLIERATAAGHTVLVCEVNSDPPNPASDAFHAALGFALVGHAAIHGGSKSVRYLLRPLAPAQPRGPG